jgi:hypothetical protein
VQEKSRTVGSNGIIRALSLSVMILVVSYIRVKIRCAFNLHLSFLRCGGASSMRARAGRSGRREPIISLTMGRKVRRRCSVEGD